MTREEQVKFCMLCKNRKMDFQQGYLCKLTDKIADFEGSCPNFLPDEAHNIATPAYKGNHNDDSDGISWKTIGSAILFILVIVRFIYRMSR
jgi:hypothetical protein